MLKNFLKRFEKLENAPKDNYKQNCLRISKRFERLEVGDKRVEISIHDKIIQQEKAPPEINYFIFCPYCARENNAELEFCGFCHHSLRSLIDQEYQRILLKKCICGAVNQKERKNCWACGRDFSLWGDKDAKQASDNIIVLNIDGTVYKSSDRNLPSGIVVLMEKIRREGYKKEIIDEWIKERNLDVEEIEKKTASRLSDIRLDIILRIVVIIVILAISLWAVRSCDTLFRF